MPCKPIESPYSHSVSLNSILHVEDENIADAVLRTHCRSLKGNAVFSFFLSTHKNPRRGVSRLRVENFLHLCFLQMRWASSLCDLWHSTGAVPSQTYKGRGENDPLHGVIFLACFSCFAATNEGFILCRTRVPGTNRAPKRRLTWQSSLRG